MADSLGLFAEKVTLKLPERISTFGRLEGNLLKRLAAPAQISEVASSDLPAGSGFRCTAKNGFTFAILDRETSSLKDFDAVLKVSSTSSLADCAAELEAGGGKWILPKARKPTSLQPSEIAKQIEDVRASWLDAFFAHDERYSGNRLIRRGLRLPQLGAINATRAHWSVSTKPATLVLPTGTGKTEIMLSLLVSERLERLLVIVPTDQLRTQIAEKFITLGVLKHNGCLAPEALHPSVVVLKHSLPSLEALDRLVASAQVIVSTMKVVAGMPAAFQARLAASITHLFVDEAHHIAANTWRSFKLQFGAKPILQFTATPFRRDGKRVDGKFIYVYPLRRAQEDKLFKPIRYIPIHGLTEQDTDTQIIRSVGEKLQGDLAAGFNHLVMARTSTVARATALHGRYQALLPQYNPQLIHNDMPASVRAHALNELRKGASRIIVCVDMLGEGFDLPDLKIAALHDKHRSEAVTLQFIGRFTRVREDLGDATVIANVAVDDVNERLKALYTEDADWNHLLSVAGHTNTERERRREDVFSGFAELPEEIPLETFEPRLSTVAYLTTCDEWRPEAAVQAITPNSTLIEGPFVNTEHRLLVFVTRDEERLRWTSVKSPRNVEYNMVMAHWDAEQDLLFINSSRLKDLHTELAKQLVGDDAQRISGETVFRVLHGFRRLVLMNLGLSETQRKPVRYSMFMGSDIADQLDTLPGNRSRTKTNLFGQGYVDVEEMDDSGRVIGTWPQKATIGCSTKGKLWSYQTTNSLAEWIEWCHSLGKRLLNSSITNETILRNVIRPRRLGALPSEKTPIAIAWPERFLYDSEERIHIQIGDERLPFFNCDIQILDFQVTDAIRFRVGSAASFADYELKIDNGVVTYAQSAGAEAKVLRTRKEQTLLDVFKEDPPHVYFADGDMLVDAELFVLRREEQLAPYDVNKIQALDWTGVDIRRESQGPDRRTDSIQHRIIQRLLDASTSFDIIFDDDGAGEVADVVSLRRAGRNLYIELYHCKYSSQSQPGGRVADLYEVCGQAQKSIRWAERLDEFLHHLRRREGDRRRNGGASRFQSGEMATLLGSSVTGAR